MKRCGKRAAQLLLPLACIVWSAADAADACLPYEPSRVELSGLLERKTFPGRPNYESLADGDEPETGFYLKLSKPVCAGVGEADSNYDPQHDVNLVQLVLEEKGYNSLRPLLGKHVTLSGELFAAHTAHHHAPLLMNHVSIAVITGKRSVQ